VLEQLDGSLIALPPVEIIPAEGAFDYEAKYIAKATQEICPARFAADVNEEIRDHAMRAHKALSCSGYSRSDFVVTKQGPVFLETNTLPGLTKASLYPKALKAEGIEFVDFLRGQIALAEKRAHKS
jgi:D-alanine-D-alanine ligase